MSKIFRSVGLKQRSTRVEGEQLAYSCHMQVPNAEAERIFSGVSTELFVSQITSQAMLLFSLNAASFQIVIVLSYFKLGERLRGRLPCLQGCGLSMCRANKSGHRMQ